MCLLSYHDILLLYAARYLSVALLTPPIFYVVNRWPVTGDRAAARGSVRLRLPAVYRGLRRDSLVGAAAVARCNR